MSSNSGIAVSVRGLSKSYSIAHDAVRHTTVAEALVHKLRNPFARVQRETFWALDDVSFELERGDVVGVIGRNGAGKSTLLKILSRITEPTRGEVDLYGRVGSLLEVGTGFHPELTGRENISLNGAILGMTKREIAREFDAIVDFAGVEQFLDTPVKRYSSGMYVRLAFAVAAHLNPEILIVDEVLAVGDAEFQKKCLGKMQDVAKSGRTVLFVSHQMQAVSVLCNRAIYLEHGHVDYIGDVEGAISRYASSFEKPYLNCGDPAKRPGTGEFRISEVSPLRESFYGDERKGFRFRFERKAPYFGKLYVSCVILDDRGTIISQCDSRLKDFWIDAVDSFEGAFGFTTPWLKPGRYRVDIALCSAVIIDRLEQACFIIVNPLLPYSSTASSDALERGVVFADFQYDATIPQHHVFSELVSAERPHGEL